MNAISYYTIIHQNKFVTEYQKAYRYLDTFFKVAYFISIYSQKIYSSDKNFSKVCYYESKSNVLLLVLASSTKIISFNNGLGDLLMTLVTVRNKVDHASLWNTIITDTECDWSIA